MFQVGEAVLYDMWGVCTIEAVEQQKTPEGLQEYLVLRPVYHSSAKLYLPNRQETLEAALRTVITRGEIEALLGSLKEDAVLWTEDPRERAQSFRRILASGDRKALLGLIRLLYLRKKELRRKGKNLRMADEQTLREGEKLLNGEFAYVLQIPPEQVPDFIHTFIEASEE